MSNSSKYIKFLLIILLSGCNKKPDIVFSPFSPPNNLAYNSGYELYPNPLESDKGWGGAPFKWQIVDGIRTKVNYWNYGLAFTGGRLEYIDTCGWRQATINFGKAIAFNRIVVWINTSGAPELPDSFKIMHWNDQQKLWEISKQVYNKLEQLNPIIPIVHKECEKLKISVVIPYEETFPTIKSSKVRFMFNNCGIDHGWLNEFEVYNDSIIDQNNNLVVKLLDGS